MRKVLFTALVSAALLALGAGSALAREHHSRSHHHRGHHARTHIRRFGRDVKTSGTSGTTGNDTAGTVASFTGGVLTLRLSDGSQVSGKVTDATELQCTSGMTDMSRTQDSGSGGDNGGDQSGDNNASGSGDNSGSGSGEDNGGNDSGDTEDNGATQTCTTSALTPGAVVQDAELKVSSPGASWDKVELAQ